MYRFLMFLSVLFSVFAASANDPSLVGQWKFEKEFTGKDTQQVSADILPKDLKELTFSAWVQPNDLSGFREIFRKEDVGQSPHNSGGENRLLFSFQNDGNFLTLGLNCGGNYAECDALMDSQEVLDGKEHFVAGTFDGKTMRVYLDGQEIGSYPRQGQLQTANDFAPFAASRDAWATNNLEPYRTVKEPAYIGSSSGRSEFFTGRMNDVRFYKRALSSGEISRIWSAGSSQKLKHGSERADKFYSKQETYTATLLETQKLVAKSGLIDSPTLIALHRLIRNDFPDEVNAYLVKFQRSPVGVMTWSKEKLQKRAEELKVAYAEYLPLTEEQWKYLSDNERIKWERVKNYLAALKEENTDSVSTVTSLYPIVLDMENVVEERPHVSERVAPYRNPETPAVQDQTAAQAQKIIETEWLFQCGNKPTIQRSLDEINWARNSAARILKQYPNQPHLFDKELEALAKLNERAVAEADAAPQKLGQDLKDLYFAVRTVKRNILFKNPVIDFDTLVYVDGPTPDGNEWRHETRHQLGYMAVPGGRLMTLKGLKPDGHQEKLLPQEPLHGSFWRQDISFDGKRVLASFKPHNEKTFHLYEIDVDTKQPRQLTAGMFDDLDPIYLPDGKNIMFLTTRGHIYVRCMPPTNAMVMARMNITGKPDSLYLVSRNGEPEYTPSVMNDGRVLYTRWEYTDKPLWRAQSLWTMNADGTQVQTFWGNQSVWPDLLKDARQIPNSEKVMFTGAGHHNWFGGVVGIIDPGKGFNYPDGLTKVTQELPWGESGNGPADNTDALKESKNYHLSGNYTGYYSPYPLSEKDFLVSAERPDLTKERLAPESSKKPGALTPDKSAPKWVLLLMDTDGNRELILEGDRHIFDAQPLRPRAVPPVKPDQVEWTTFENRDKPATGVIYSNNVYENAPPELKDKAKYLRIWSIEHKTYTFWSRRNYVSSGPELSMNQSEGVKKIIGTVPIEDDGSVSFNAPSGVALHFQLLDENRLALQTMKSFTGVLPGEARGCLGCHESMTRSPVTNMTGKALKRVPSNIKPVPWEDITVGYERYVQPVLDKHCGKCHQDPDHKAYQAFNATLRPGFIGFKEPYITLMGRPSWGSAYREPQRLDEGKGGFGWADTILVEAYDQRDPKAYQTYPAMTKLSYKSRLVKRMMSGEHNGVKVSGDELLRVILWVDAMGPYFGADEVRCLEDPIFQGKGWISQPPRVMTAPIIQRPGPFDPYFYDSAYDAPPKEKINALPVGVNR